MSMVHLPVGSRQSQASDQIKVRDTNGLDFALGNGNWWSTPVPFVQPTGNTGIAFDVMSKGPVSKDVWIDIVSNDVIADGANYETLSLKKRRCPAEC